MSNQKYFRNGRFMSAAEMTKRGLIGQGMINTQKVSDEELEKEKERLKSLDRKDLAKEFEDKIKETSAGRNSGELINKIINFFKFKK